ncbi:uncharacterized protein N7506_003189 [Penicillium brevicompactum]|uniref:uncharacterized protein n=1 Tax=Penicillium brevicompactum TaxID=5074 RepID=UPI0025419A06|nr:uncharacterized protein N7506_003189 [Penicillium brevicompactum]KAJ5343365.1 hypothetical protein N7506_003189 [Penicillium brevicompactum]
MQAINFMDVCDVSAQRQSSLRHFCGWIESGSGSSERLTGYSISGRLKERDGRSAAFANRSLGQRAARSPPTLLFKCPVIKQSEGDVYNG